MKKFLLIFIIYCGLSILHSYAQGPPPPPPPPGSLSGGDTSAPIDTDIVLLLIAATSFSVFKLHRRKIAD